MSYSSRRFPTTAWSIFEKAKDPDSPEYLAAINRFVSGYWRPVFYFLRAKGYPLHKAEDLTQDFFVRCMEKEWIAKADPQRGRFRNYLLKILTRFLSDHSPGRERVQSTFESGLVSISALVGDDERQFEPSHDEVPEQLFMKQWARALLSGVRSRVELWCHEHGRPDWFEIFSSYYFPPPDRGKVGQQALAQRFKLSRDKVRYALDQTNEQFVQFLRAEVAGQVESETEIDAEIREIKSLL